MEQMQGDILVDSVKGIGSCFEIVMSCEHQHISLVDSYQKPTQEPLVVETSTDYQKLKLLVAEDNTDNQLLIQVLLQKLGIHAVIVENGHKAVERVLLEHFDLVLMDMQMPEMGGRSDGLNSSCGYGLTYYCLNSQRDERRPKPIFKGGVPGRLI